MINSPPVATGYHDRDLTVNLHQPTSASEAIVLTELLERMRFFRLSPDDSWDFRKHGDESDILVPNNHL